ncbi:MAG: TolC family protein [Isosphaeraceae bacterium]|nr:TolC family protein [Isosphaeraceae bacterium]
MSTRFPLIAAVALLLVLATGTRASAQGPTIDSPAAESPGGDEALLGASPGAGVRRESPGTTAPILGGRAGASAARVPVSISAPPTPTAAPLPGSSTRIGSVEPAERPIFGFLAVPKVYERGPADGLTLDAAIDRLVRENLELRAQFLEIPQAQADILTASLRANPILYADAQLIPYGKFDDERPGGQRQFDVNVSVPVDVTHKRRARILAACRAKRVVEAQYRDAVRVQIDNLYTAYVDMLAARGAIRFAEVGIAGLEQAITATRELVKRGERTNADLRRVQILLDTATIGLEANRRNYVKTKRDLGLLLTIPPEEAERIEPLGSLREPATEAFTAEALVDLALRNRPDLEAFRLGVSRAEAEVGLARANRLSDVYVLLQPYTFQDNSSEGRKSATSYAVGVTVPLPVSNRNQGNIERARLNVEQTRIQLAALERRVATEVREAVSEYALAIESVRRLEAEINPASERALSDSEELYRGGEFNFIEYLNARSQYNDVSRQYLEALVRYRRSMLGLNTAVGVRIAP